MQRDTRGYGKARIEILSLKGRVVPWREYGNNTDVFPPRKNTSSRSIRAKLNRVTNKQREEREKERYENISFSRSRARFRSLRSKWVMRTRRTNDPDGRMRKPAVHSRRKEFGGGKERRITGLARWRWGGGWMESRRDVCGVGSSGKVGDVSQVKAAAAGERCSRCSTTPPLPFLPSFLFFLPFSPPRVVSSRNNPTPFPVSARDQAGPQREGVGRGRPCLCCSDGR